MVAKLAKRNGSNGHTRTQSSRRIQEPSPPFPAQHQSKPGLESRMNPRPRFAAARYHAAGKLEGKVALITGGDSGIGRAVANLYAREGADVAIVFLPAEMEDARETQRIVEACGRNCLLIPGDLTDGAFCKKCIEQTVKEFGKLDILVSNAGYQNRIPGLEKVTDEEFDRTSRPIFTPTSTFAAPPSNISSPARPSSSPVLKPALKALKISSPIPPRRARSMPSPKRCRWSWRKRESA
jgi:hypothetical protein